MEPIISIIDDPGVLLTSGTKPKPMEVSSDLPDVCQLLLYDYNPYESSGEVKSAGVAECKDKDGRFESSSSGPSLTSSVLSKLYRNSESDILGKDNSISSKDVFHIVKAEDFQEQKGNTSKRFRSELDLKAQANTCGKSINKTRLERNRKSARECRMRKKMYVKNLEIQIKCLQRQLLECQKELNNYKVKEQQSFFAQFNNQDIPKIDPDSSTSYETSNSRQSLNNYIVMYYKYHRLNAK